MSDSVRKLAAILFMSIVAPSVGYAQASIAGVVKDTSGAILPGVTAEASSPVLIEKVRTAVTDASGRYQIVDLRPGEYSVTFTLPGFTTVRREGILLIGEPIGEGEAQADAPARPSLVVSDEVVRRQVFVNHGRLVGRRDDPVLELDRAERERAEEVAKRARHPGSDPERTHSVRGR